MIKYLAVAVMALSFASVTFVSCHGHLDPVEDDTDLKGGESEGGNGAVDSTLLVPEGVLRIFADKTEIVADGNDKVTFKVMFGSKDVSNEKTLQLVRSYEGEKPKYMEYGKNEYTTSTAGTYTFKAEYFYAGKFVTDNEIKVTATPFFSGETAEYSQRVLGVYFTSTSCTSCPSASAGIKKLQTEHPGEISIVAFHKYLAMPDPMEIPETEEFRNLMGGFTGLPRLFWNMRKGTNLIGPDFSVSYAEEIASYQPSCGVALATSFDEKTRELKIDVGVKSNLPAVYRYIVFLVEDGIDEYEQNGDYYVHDNVVRDVVTPVTGRKLNNELPLTVGVEVKASESVVLSPDWELESMRVVAAALVSEDGGYTYIVNNVNECPLGETVDYLYKE